MKTYCYYSRSDKNLEILDKTETTDYSKALEFFSFRKQLSPEKFSELYIIMEIDKNGFK